MRVMIYDRTCVHARGRLSPVWAAGGALYRAMRRIDRAHGVASWDEALAILGALREPITELQYWGHGKWGGAFVDEDFLGAADLAPAARRRPLLDAVRERLAPDALVWFRTCETFGARRGQDFAERLADYLGARVAGHTYVVHFHQSGLHGLRPGTRATWDPTEGLLAGSADDPQRARWSVPWAPRTITCLAGRVPDRWFG